MPRFQTQHLKIKTTLKVSRNENSRVIPLNDGFSYSVRALCFWSLNMNKIISILAVIFATSWIVGISIPLPEEVDPYGYNRLFGLIIISFLLLLLGLLSLSKKSGLKWHHSAILLLTPVMHYQGSKIPLPFNVLFFFVPLILILIIFSRKTKKLKTRP